MITNVSDRHALIFFLCIFLANAGLDPTPFSQRDLYRIAADKENICTCSMVFPSVLLMFGFCSITIIPNFCFTRIYYSKTSSI